MKVVGKRFGNDTIISGTKKTIPLQGRPRETNPTIPGAQIISAQRRHKTLLTLVPPGYYLPELLQCDCGKTYKNDTGFQNHIDACPNTKKGFRSLQQVLVQVPGMLATSCKNDRILWDKLMSKSKATNLPLSNLDVNSFIKE